MVKYPPANAGDERDMGLILEFGRSSGEGNGNPFQNPCLENSMDRGALVGYSPQGHKESDTIEHNLDLVIWTLLFTINH